LLRLVECVMGGVARLLLLLPLVLVGLVGLHLLLQRLVGGGVRGLALGLGLGLSLGLRLGLRGMRRLLRVVRMGGRRGRGLRGRLCGRRLGDGLGLRRGLGSDGRGDGLSDRDRSGLRRRLGLHFGRQRSHRGLDTIPVQSAKAEGAELHLHLRHAARQRRREDDTLVVCRLVSQGGTRARPRLLSCLSLGHDGVEARRTGVSRNRLGSDCDRSLGL
jgi:hypothetical protein